MSLQTPLQTSLQPFPGALKPPSASVDVSFIIPVYNEMDNVDPLVHEVLMAGQQLKRPFEILIVDDGSTDETVARLREKTLKVPELRVICLKRNYGQTPATAAGFSHARGKYIVTLDGDLQNDPADVPKLLQQLEEKNLDIITGWRKDRKDKAVTRKLPSKIANWLIGLTTGVKVHDYGCSLKLYRAEIAKSVPLYGEMHRFIPALASIDGATIEEVPVNHRPRTRGESKYNLSRTFKVVLDLMTVLFMKRFFTRPLHMFGRMGMVFLFVGGAALAYLVFDKLVLGDDIGTRPLLILSVLSIMTGIQLLSTGLIAEIQVRTYFESQNKPIYTIKEILGQEILAQETLTGLP